MTGHAGYDRRKFLQAIGAGFLSLSMPLPSVAAEKNNKPNVILILTDDQGYGDLSCLGNPILKTPNLDKLYEQSIRLTDFHVSPTCAPTRASLMTGRYCNRTGVWHTVMGRSLLRKDEITMADVFKSSGYKTAIFGKWHLGDNYPFRPQDRGFDEVLIHGGGGIGQSPDYWGNDYFDDTYIHNGKLEKFNGYCTDIWFDETIKFINANKQKPFFCYLPINAPHWPYIAPEKYAKMYERKDVPDANFYGMVANIDDNIAKLEKALKSTGLSENTILIFMTDNGTSAGFKDNKGFNAGMRGTKNSEYDGGHRVPCFIRWPDGNITGPKDIPTLSAHIDILPTLIDMCELEKPANVKFDGVSLKPLLQSNLSNGSDRVLVVDSQRLEYPIKWRKSAVMTQKYRLINGMELYDISADPGQNKDISEKNLQMVKHLRAEYDKWWQDISTRFDEYSRIIIGSEMENPVALNCMDWHTEGEIPPWNQTMIRNAEPSNGFWAIHVAKSGRYEIELRRWPIELNKPINSAIENSKAINAKKARLKVSGIDETKPVTDTDTAVKFTVDLKSGDTFLQTWFIDNNISRGAYYVYVKQL